MIAMGTLADQTVELLERHRHERVEPLTERVTDALVAAHDEHRTQVDRADLVE